MEICSMVDNWKYVLSSFMWVLCMEYVVRASKGCEQWEFRCQSSGTCLKFTGRCNGRTDCADGSDELRCPNTSDQLSKLTMAPCPSGQFQCGNGQCVYNKWICDEENDCGDNSDEFGCATSSADHNHLSLGAVIGISLGCSVVLLLLMLTTGYMIYYRMKSRRRRRAPDPIQEITDIMGGVPYHMPREALLRVPPPQYTSSLNLAAVQDNHGFVIDEVLNTEEQEQAKPPPLYSSRPDLTLTVHQSSSDQPPLYSSRQNLNEGASTTLEVHQNYDISRECPNFRLTNRNLGLNNPRMQALRSPNGRVARVRETTIPVLNRIATFARSSLSRSRRNGQRRNRSRRCRSSSASTSSFHYSKPQSLRQEGNRTTQRVLTQQSNEIDSDGVITSNYDSEVTESQEISAAIQMTDFHNHTTDTVLGQVNEEKEINKTATFETCNNTKKTVLPGVRKKVCKVKSFSLNSKCKSVPELAIQTVASTKDTSISKKQNSNIFAAKTKNCEEVKNMSLSDNWDTFNGKKTRSLNHLVDIKFSLIEKDLQSRRSLSSLESFTC